MRKREQERREKRERKKETAASQTKKTREREAKRVISCVIYRAQGSEQDKDSERGRGRE